MAPIEFLHRRRRHGESLFTGATTTKGRKKCELQEGASAHAGRRKAVLYMRRRWPIVGRAHDSRSLAGSSCACRSSPPLGEDDESAAVCPASPVLGRGQPEPSLLPTNGLPYLCRAMFLPEHAGTAFCFFFPAAPLHIKRFSLGFEEALRWGRDGCVNSCAAL
ncbi:hypothetical protein MRX96_004445 [Rhipicephalus microplus]